MTSTDPEAICEWVSRPCRKRHGTAVAGFLSASGTVLRQFDGAGEGRMAKEAASSIYEIGSVTKTFTAVLMCELSRRGIIDIDRPIGAWLNGFEKLPDWITPLRLATHTSGLPRIPDRMKIADISNPYAAITEAMLQEWAANRKAFAPATESASYSNLGFGLLGLALGHAAKTGYRHALREYVTMPLGLLDTDTQVPVEKADRLMQPHRIFGRAAKVWDFDALAGCGALKSTAFDVGRYAEALIEARTSGEGPLAAALIASTEIRIPAAKPFMPSGCFGWMQLRGRKDDAAVFHHDGGTGGSSSTLFVCPQHGYAAFSLANTQTTAWTAFRQIMSDPIGMLDAAAKSRQEHAPAQADAHPERRP